MIARTQCQLVLRHLLKKGPLTAGEALRLYSIGRLAARIHELNRPLPQKLITKQMVSVRKANGEKAFVARYSLARSA